MNKRQYKKQLKKEEAKYPVFMLGRRPRDYYTHKGQIRMLLKIIESNKFTIRHTSMSFPMESIHGKQDH